MPKFISKDKRVSLRDLYEIIKSEWESTIKNGDGDLRNFTYVTPTWRGLIILDMRVYSDLNDRDYLNRLSLVVYSTILRERLEFTVSSDEDGRVGGKELLSLVGHDGEVDLRHPFAWMILDVALKGGFIEEVKSVIISLFFVSGF